MVKARDPGLRNDRSGTGLGAQRHARVDNVESLQADERRGEILG